MSDIIKETDKNEINDITDISGISDQELMDDLGLDLGNSLKTAFDNSKITVSEDLIAATMAKIKMLEQEEKESKADTDNEIHGTDAGIMQNSKAVEKKVADGQGGKTTETKSAEAPDNVVSINDKKRRFRSIMRIAGPVAAALIIGIFGLSVIRNNLMTKEATNDANFAPATDSSYFSGAANGLTLKEAQYDATESATKAEAPETVKAEEYGMTANSEVSEWSTADIQDREDMAESTLEDEKNLQAAGTAMELGGIIESSTSSNTDKEQIEDSGEADQENDITGHIYAIPAELVAKVSEITAGYAAGTITAAEYNGVSDIDADLTVRDGMDASMIEGRTGTADADETTGNDDITGAPADTGTSDDIETPAEPADQLYLVVGDGVFYFTSKPDAVPDEGTVIYLIEDPDCRTAEMIEELDRMPELKQ